MDPDFLMVRVAAAPVGTTEWYTQVAMPTKGLDNSVLRFAEEGMPQTCVFLLQTLCMASSIVVAISAYVVKQLSQCLPKTPPLGSGRVYTVAPPAS
jgi:hypothetical protein